MSRVQLALNVADLQQSIDFYTKLFRTPPAKIRDGYANFAITDPPLKLVLFQGGTPGTLNHLGVEVESTDEVVAAIGRAAEDGLAHEVQEHVDCCHAVQDKVWVEGPDTKWEFYKVLADSPTSSPAAAEGEAVCCTPAAEAIAEPVTIGAPASGPAPSCCG